MRDKIRNFFLGLLSQDMAKQARQVEIITIVVFIILLILAGFLWQYKIELTAVKDHERVVIGKMNVFELLLSKGKEGD